MSRDRRLWPFVAVAFAAYFAGMLTVVAMTLFGPQPKKTYELTEDVDITAMSTFDEKNLWPKAPFRKGTRFSVEMRKGVVYYLSFPTAVEAFDLAPFCMPVDGSPPFLDPKSTASSSIVPSQGQPSSSSQK